MQNTYDTIFKWNWMMIWCKEHRLAPANSTAWEMARKAYDEHFSQFNEDDQS